MAYLKYFDNRFGDLYEIYTDDVTGEFEMAMRHAGVVGQDSIYYGTLEEIPPYHRNQVENMIWKKSHPKSSPKEE